MCVLQGPVTPCLSFQRHERVQGWIDFVIYACRQSSNPVLMREQGVEHYQGGHIDFCEAQWGGLQKTDRALKPHACSFVDGSVEHHEWAFLQ